MVLPSADSTWHGTHDIRIRGASGRFADVNADGELLVEGGLGGGVSQEDGSAYIPGTSSFTPIGGYREDSPTQLADGEAGAARLTLDRELLVEVANAGDIGGGTQYTEDDAAPANPVGTALALVRDDALSGQTTTDGDVVAARGTDKGEVYVKHVDAIPVTDNGGALTVDGSVSLAAALPAGTNNIGDVDVLSIAAGANLIGDVGLQPRASGGLSIFRSIDLDESEEEVKATAGQVYMIAAFNRTAAPLYLKFYNATAANVTVGSTAPVATFVVPANADSDGAGFVLNIPQGLEFSTAITVAATTGVADADTGAPGANDCVVVIGYE